MYFDGIVVHVRRANSRAAPHTIFVAIGVNLKEHRELIGPWLTEEEAEAALAEFGRTWDTKYPMISKSWRERWLDIRTLFEFPWEIRRVISTTNTIESVNSVIRKSKRNKRYVRTRDRP